MNIERDIATYAAVKIVAPGGELLHVKVASTFVARFLGLLPRSHLHEDEGLLFAPGGSIHTLGMRFDIDIVFLTAQLEVARVAHRTQPGSWIFAPRATRFVLEVKAGVAAAKRIEVGTRLSLSPITNTERFSAE